MTNQPGEDINDAADLYEHFRFEADPGQKLLRIDKFLVNRIENVSRSLIQNAATAGNILVNDSPVKSNYRVRPGDIITIVMAHPPREVELLPEDIPVNVIYEDDHLVVVNKAPGMVVHPGHGNYTGTLINALAWRFREMPLFESGELRPGLVHRIDKNTSGLLVVAKTELAMNRLARQFFERKTRREYDAIVWGRPEPAEGSIEGHIGRHSKDRMRMDVFPDGSQGKYALTHYRLVEDLGYISHVECRLETGRTHQIRVHLEHIGHPLFNDERYGGDQILRGTTFTKYKQFVQNCFKVLPRHALHARTLGFKHPATDRELWFETELPDDIQQLIDKWKRYTGSRDEI
ncbi:MAG: RluA family pseudouridine synthase [Marinilabiliales bacterium]|nr:MAG: RluA family pseudouridine synthase [Marinilabiliales bacterium]